MNSYIHRLQKTSNYLKEIEKDYPDSILWEMLHRASWHYHIHWVYWIETNNDFIEKIKTESYQVFGQKNSITDQFYKTVFELKNFEK